MTHFGVLVVLPGDIPWNQVEEATARVLAPYDENGEWFTDGSRWDWWQIGGRWTGSLLAMSGASSTKRGAPGVFDNDLYLPGGWDVLRKKDIDWEGMAAARYQEALSYYDKGEWKQWKGFIDIRDDDTRESYAVRIRDQFQFSSYVDKEGKWNERARTGWFGAELPDEEGKEPQSKDEWQSHWDEMISSLDPDDILVVVDCHV